MPSLAELLVADGVLDRRRRSEIAEAQAVYGGSFDTNVLESGAIDERQLQVYLERAHGAANRVDVWAEPDSAAIALLRRQQAEKYRVVPFRLTGRVLDVLVNDPTDMRALDEVAFISGCRLVVNVATEMRVAFHLFANYQIGLPHRLQQLLMRKPAARPDPFATQAPAGGASVAQPETVERPSIALPELEEDVPRVTPAPPRVDLRTFTPNAGVPVVGAPPQPAPPQSREAPIEIALPPPRLPLPAVPAPPRQDTALPPSAPPGPAPIPPHPSGLAIAPPGATFLGPPPFADYPEFQETPPAAGELLATRRPAGEPIRRNYEGIAKQLAQVQNRDEIPGIVLPYLGTLLSRVVLFTVRKNQLVGWDARGRRLRRETVETLAFRLDRPSVFEAVIVGGVPFDGPLPQEDTEESLVIKLGDDEWPEHVAIVPIRVKDRAIALIYGEASSADALAAAREPATVLAELIGETFVRLILKRKTSPP